MVLGKAFWSKRWLSTQRKDDVLGKSTGVGGQQQGRTILMEGTVSRVGCEGGRTVNSARLQQRGAEKGREAKAKLSEPC